MEGIASFRGASSVAVQDTSLGRIAPQTKSFHHASSLGVCAQAAEQDSNCFNSVKKIIANFFKNLSVFIKGCCCCKSSLPPQVKKLKEAVQSDQLNRQEILDVVNKEFKEGKTELLKAIGTRWISHGLTANQDVAKKDVLEGIGQRVLNAFNPNNPKECEALRGAVSDFIAKF